MEGRANGLVLVVGAVNSAGSVARFAWREVESTATCHEVPVAFCPSSIRRARDEERHWSCSMVAAAVFVDGDDSGGGYAVTIRDR